MNTFVKYAKIVFIIFTFNSLNDVIDNNYIS